jgi:ubiquinone/menaquinone biosynthesis C-methylase UbiE
MTSVPSSARPRATAGVPFSESPTYKAMNRRFASVVRDQVRGEVVRVLDLAGGAGDHAAARLVGGERAAVVVVDAAWQSLARTVSVARAEGSADALPLRAGALDVALVGNAVHCFEHKDRAMAELGRVLRPGGVVGFNTAFYGGTLLAGTQEFYAEWVKGGLRRAMSSGGRRPRHRRDAPAFTQRWLTRDEFRSLVDEAGLDLVTLEERVVRLSRSDLEGLCHPDGTWETDLASVLLAGYPLDVACRALADSVAPALDAAGLSEVPRGWLEVVARRGEP